MPNYEQRKLLSEVWTLEKRKRYLRREWLLADLRMSALVSRLRVEGVSFNEEVRT